jgi:hypothetical protein
MKIKITRKFGETIEAMGAGFCLQCPGHMPAPAVRGSAIRAGQYSPPPNNHSNPNNKIWHALVADACMLVAWPL